MLKLPAGEYYLGDPCYVIAADKWVAFLNKGEILDDGFTSKVFEYQNRNVFVASTAYGDGCYRDNYGNEYGVDAGLLGAIPVELISKIKTADAVLLGQLVDFKKDFSVYRDRNGTIIFGNFEIVTDGSLFDDEDDEDESE